MIADEQGLVKRQTVQSMVRAWNDASDAIRQSYGLIHTAMRNLDVAFRTDYGLHVRVGRDSYLGSGEWEAKKADEVIEQLRRQAWRVIVSHMEVRRVLSKVKCDELDKMLESGEGLPPINEEAIVTMFENTMRRIPEYIEESVKEVWEFLRPHRNPYREGYVTNDKFGQELGNRVVISWALEGRWGGGWYVSHYKEHNLRAMDNIFHALDGKGTVPTGRGPLVDAIQKVDPAGVGSTAYFKFKCYKNRNLHLEFLRPDLVARINAIVSKGTALKGAKV